MSKLLLNEKPLLVMPKLATEIGLNESIFLQQMHYWITEKFDNKEKYKDSFIDGYIWVYNTYEKWQEQFPFWSISTIRRIISSLIDKQLLIKADKNYNKKGFDQTSWYTIDYFRLGLLEEKLNKEDEEHQEKERYFNPPSK